MGNLNSDVLVIIIAALMTAPGLYALYKGLHKDLAEENLRLQVESYAIEIRRLQTLVDQQQRKINELEVVIANLKAKLSAVGKALKRITEQLRAHNIEPAVDGNKLLDILEKD